MKFKRLIILVFLISFSVCSFAQHHEQTKHRYWRISPFIGHTFVALEQGGEHTPIASWALDIEYWWSERFGLGLHNDLEIESFVIQDQKGEFIKRDFPFVTSLDLLVKPWKEFVIYAGPGIEIDANRSFELVRVGLEYEFALNDNFDLAPTFFYDNRFDSFNTWTIAFGVGYRF